MKDVNFLKSNDIDVDHGVSILGDMEIYDLTLGDFLDEIDGKVKNITLFKDYKNMSSYAIDAHAIKSDAKYLGFTKLAEIAYQHELASKENNLEFVTTNFDSFIAEINRVVNIVKQYLGR